MAIPCPFVDGYKTDTSKHPFVQLADLLDHFAAAHVEDAEADKALKTAAGKLRDLASAPV